MSRCTEPILKTKRLKVTSFAIARKVGRAKPIWGAIEKIDYLIVSENYLSIS